MMPHAVLRSAAMAKTETNKGLSWIVVQVALNKILHRPVVMFSVGVLEDKSSSTRILEYSFEVLGLDTQVLGLWPCELSPWPWPWPRDSSPLKNLRTHSSPIIACFAQTTSGSTT